MVSVGVACSVVLLSIIQVTERTYLLAYLAVLLASLLVSLPSFFVIRGHLICIRILKYLAIASGAASLSLLFLLTEFSYGKLSLVAIGAGSATLAWLLLDSHGYRAMALAFKERWDRYRQQMKQKAMH